MIPNKKRAERLDERLRVLGFHARASGVYKTAASASAAAMPAANAHAKADTGDQSSSREGDMPEREGRKRLSGSGRSKAKAGPLTPEEKQESMAKMVEACKKKRPGTADGESGVDQR